MSEPKPKSRKPIVDDFENPMPQSLTTSKNQNLYHEISKSFEEHLRLPENPTPIPSTDSLNVKSPTQNSNPSNSSSLKSPVLIPKKDAPNSHPINDVQQSTVSSLDTINDAFENKKPSQLNQESNPKSPQSLQNKSPPPQQNPLDLNMIPSYKPPQILPPTSKPLKN